MLAKKSLSSSPDRRKSLDYLYARKSAIDAAIQSLEDYNQFRSKPPSGCKLK
jgi:hypothetical protein